MVGGADARDDAVRQLVPLDACVVSDALDSLRVVGTPLGIHAMWEGAKVVGRAVTMRLSPVGAHHAEKPVHLGVSALEASRPGDVIVVDNGGRSDMGAWGGLLSVAAVELGVAGVVIDGALRDVDEARSLRFPVFARAPVTRTARHRVTEVSQGEPIDISGVRVRTGDVVIGDASGVVIVPADRLVETARIAESFARRESAMQDGLRRGLSPSEVMGAEYQEMLGRGRDAGETSGVTLQESRKDGQT
jgi:regulator of RNase E activity RraA